MRAILILTLCSLAGCATTHSDTPQKYDPVEGYNFGVGIRPQPPLE